MFTLTPEKMRRKLLADAERRLIEAEHMESRWKHAANQAREEVARLSAQPNQSPVKPTMTPEVARSIENSIQRSYIGQPQT